MIVQSWDTAIKAGQANDASACATFYYDGDIHLLIDMRVIRLEYPHLKKFILSHALRYTPEAVLIEDKSSGGSLIQDLRGEGALGIVAVNPRGDKLTRLARVSAMIEAGLVALPQRAMWLGAFEQEISAFPNAPHDDQVDAFSQYLCWVMDKKRSSNAQIRRL